MKLDNNWLKIEGLSKEYEKKNWIERLFGKSSDGNITRAVDSISFTAERGEIIGYLGPNGAGKSTTIKMIAGVLKPTRGSILIDGRNPFVDTYRYRFDLGIAFGQRTKLFWDLPVIESLNYYAALYKIAKNSRNKIIKENTESFEIDQILNKPVRQLSLGQRMKCELAVTFLHSPKLILLDEPTIGLDFNAKDVIRNLIKRAASNNNSTIILSSHDLKDVESVCSRIILLNTGKILFDGSINELSLENKLDSTIEVTIIENDMYEYLRRCLMRLNGVSLVEINKDKIIIKYHKNDAFNLILKVISDHATISSLNLKEPDLESMIRHSYLEASE